MNRKLIEQIKAIKGVKTVENFLDLKDVIVVVFEPKEPAIYDEYGVPLYEGDKYWWVAKERSAWFEKKNIMITGDKLCEPYKPYSFENTVIYTECMHDGSTPIFASLESANKWCEENKPKPIYTDPETGDEFFEGDECFHFSKETFNIKKSTVGIGTGFKSDVTASKEYKSRKECEIALANFILEKYKS